MTSPPYLVVDLDSSLIKTDTLWELGLRALRHAPWSLVGHAWILLTQGRPACKAALTKQITLDPASLPYRDSVLNLCRAHRQASPQNKLILASGADDSLVQKVAQHLGLFDHAMGSKPPINLKGQAKLTAIQAMIGSTPFRYIGDAAADLPIWQASQGAIAVNPTSRLLRKIKKQGVPCEVIADRKPLAKLVSKQMRLKQWLKNLLVYLPLLASHRIDSLTLWLKASGCFIAFSMLASCVYVMNDLLDLSADRQHPAKRKRPFAAGDLPLWAGGLALPILMILFALIASSLSVQFLLTGAVYFALNCCYSFAFKETVMLDVILLGSFYSLRIIAGGYATDIQVSYWLLAFSTFFFFGLAMIKRYTEITKNLMLGRSHLGRGYRRGDELPIFVLGIGTSLLALLVLTLYFHSPDIAVLYAHPVRLWWTLPLLLYWTSRVWILAHRGLVDDDPVLFALKDRASWALGILFLLIVTLAA